MSAPRPSPFAVSVSFLLKTPFGASLLPDNRRDFAASCAPVLGVQQCLKKVKSHPKAINEVVYDVLDGINSDSALWAIFCEENLKEYPNLKPIFQDLKNGKRKQNKKNQILDFQGNELPVHCGKNIRGVLYKDRLAKGID
ncbi:hypothetical protein lerEdw1_007980 [Lerista edwardsae]|nr:hypothetical protein lerEdw1_007980 [Lerista edwardsae]